jgi:hypothetical protein
LVLLAATLANASSSLLTILLTCNFWADYEKTYTIIYSLEFIIIR